MTLIIFFFDLSSFVLPILFVIFPFFFFSLISEVNNNSFLFYIIEQLTYTSPFKIDYDCPLT